MAQWAISVGHSWLSFLDSVAFVWGDITALWLHVLRIRSGNVLVWFNQLLLQRNQWFHCLVDLWIQIAQISYCGVAYLPSFRGDFSRCEHRHLCGRQRSCHWMHAERIQDCGSPFWSYPRTSKTFQNIYPASTRNFVVERSIVAL